MYDIKPLEEEWKKYKFKKQKPWYLTTFIVAILLLITMLFLQNKSINLQKMINTLFNISNTNDTKIEAIISNTPNKTVLINGALNVLQTKKEIQIAEEAKEKPSDILEDVPILEDGSELATEELDEPRKKIHLDIIDTTSVKAYDDVEKRFAKTHDVDDALFLANSYYNKGNYTKAEYWAMQANKLDGNIEESLLIFIKSKIKLGHKNEAISILASYIERSDSKDAIKLMNQIKSGKF